MVRKVVALAVEAVVIVVVAVVVRVVVEVAAPATIATLDDLTTLPRTKPYGTSSRASKAQRS